MKAASCVNALEAIWVLQRFLECSACIDDSKKKIKRTKSFKFSTKNLQKAQRDSHKASIQRQIQPAEVLFFHPVIRQPVEV